MSELPNARTLTDAQRSQLQDFLHTSSGQAGALGGLISDAEKNLAKLVVIAAQRAVLFTCNEVTEATWSWCGDGDAPSILGMPHITCPHVDEPVDLDQFGAVHGVDYPLSESLLGDMYEEQTFLLVSRSTQIPLTATHSRTDGWVFTLDLTASKTSPDLEPQGPYEKCANCWLFVEANDAHQTDPTLATHMHLHRGTPEDEALDQTHDATPSGEIHDLNHWRKYGPPAMRARFNV